MIDTYLKSKNRDALEAVCQSVVNSISIQQGRAETSYIDEEGNTVDVPAVGDPEYWYTCVRAAFPIQAFDGVEVCSVEEGSLVVGVWA